VKNDYLTCKGIKIGYDPDIISENLVKHINAGVYEREESSLIAGTIQDNERILEIGCGLGYISALAMKTGRVEKLLGFEANPRLIPIIEQTWSLNEVEAVIRNNVIANTSSFQKVNFYVRQDFWASSLSPELYGYKEIVSVETLNFQELLEEYRPTMIICDIEGGERQLFEGAELRGVRKVFIEVHQNVLGRWGTMKLFERFLHQDFHYDVWHSIRQVVLFSHVSRM